MTADVLRKDQLEKSLFDERKLIRSGQLQEENPLDRSPAFGRLCEAARLGNLKACREAIQEGANINASDEYNYTPLILASLCGHYDVVQLLLESGARCERDTFQGERCLYNALNNRIRNLLLAYNYSKETDPLQPYAAHLTSLLLRNSGSGSGFPATADLTIRTANRRYAFGAHRFILAARSPFFRRKLEETPGLELWVLPEKIPVESFSIVLKSIYLSELPRDVGQIYDDGYTDEDILMGVDKLALLFEIPSLMQRIIEADDRRMQRQQRSAELERGRTQIEAWFREKSLANSFDIETDKAAEVEWPRDNSIFADVLLQADYEPADELTPPHSGHTTPATGGEVGSNIPIGPMATPPSDFPAQSSDRSKSRLFPVHKAMLIRAEYFLNMFTSGFLEAQDSDHLRVIPVSCTPAVLEATMLFLYGEKTNFGLQLAIEVLFAADMLLMERLKAKAAVVISTLGNGDITTRHPASTLPADLFRSSDGDVSEDEEHPQSEEDPLDPYATLRAAWDLRVPRLETFAARYFAYRLEKYIDSKDFVALVEESASRIKGRQETDSIELVDDIRFYLSERFRLRFDGEGLNIFAEGNDDDNGGGGGGGNEVEVASAALANVSLEEQLTESVPVPGAHDIRTLDGDVAGDEFAADALNFQTLMAKLDVLLEGLQLDA